MRHPVLITVSTLVCALLTRCQNWPETHPAERNPPAAIGALTGTWQTRHTRSGNYLASTMTIYPKGTFWQIEVTKIKGAGPLTVSFSGNITPVGERSYMFFATRQGTGPLSPNPPITYTLSQDGTALRYGKGLDRVTYHRVPAASPSPTPVHP